MFYDYHGSQSRQSFGDFELHEPGWNWLGICNGSGFDAPKSILKAVRLPLSSELEQIVDDP